MTENIIISENKNFCACGCGYEIPFRNKWGKKVRYKKGHDRHTVGRYVDQGYWMVPCNPDHPKVHRGYYFEHILVMEAKLGRYLREGEIVHHDNEDKLDNRIENLVLTNRSQHMTIHRKGKPSPRKGIHKDTSDRFCYECGSNTTLMRKPDGVNHQTPYPNWFHLPNDKDNWYCNRCYCKYWHRQKNYYSNNMSLF
jgi:hypothetical protein